MTERAQITSPSPVACLAEVVRASLDMPLDQFVTALQRAARQGQATIIYPQDMAARRPASHMCEVTFHGHTAFGDTLPAAARNWRRSARTVVERLPDGAAALARPTDGARFSGHFTVGMIEELTKTYTTDEILRLVKLSLARSDADPSTRASLDAAIEAVLNRRDLTQSAALLIGAGG